MKRYDHRAIQLIFTELADQGRTQRWLAKRLGIWETRLCEMKGGRREMPDALVEQAAGLLNIPSGVLSLFASSLSSDTLSLHANRETAHAAD